MGSSVINATRLQFYGKGGALTIDSFPYTAKVKTSPLNHWVTDSAAAATAMATGNKAPNGSLSFLKATSPDKKDLKLPTLLELASRAGKRVGLVTTTTITDATPSAFYAHVENRKETEMIVKDLALSPVDIILGGGWKDIQSQQSLLKNRFAIERHIFSKKRCSNQKGQSKPIIGAFAKEDLPPAIETNSQGPLSLMALSELALECLSQPHQGFFLMVESEDIDESLHSRNIPQALFAARELDLAIANTLKWLEKKGLSDKTLVLVTADHDTGGLAVNDPVPDSGLWAKDSASGRYFIPLVKGPKYSGPAYPVTRLSTDQASDLNSHSETKAKAPHTSADVDLYARGPGSERVHGTIENTHIFKLAQELFLPNSEKAIRVH